MRIVISLAVIALAACSSTVPNRKPVGEKFPTVSGQTLTEQPTTLPDDVVGPEKPTVLLVAYEQDAQFDVDRWLLGMLQGGVDARIYEVPTVKGFVPELISGRIDEGMRSGIPSEDWAIVITVYEDAGEIVAFTGNERGLNARVMVLDQSGKVVWFHDEGYSARELMEMKSAMGQ